jgi:hypothetical protein
MLNLFFFLLGCGLTVAFCWLYHSLQALGTIFEHDEHEDLTQ